VIEVLSFVEFGVAAGAFGAFEFFESTSAGRQSLPKPAPAEIPPGGWIRALPGKCRDGADCSPPFDVPRDNRTVARTIHSPQCARPTRITLRFFAARISVSSPHLVNLSGSNENRGFRTDRVSGGRFLTFSDSLNRVQHDRRTRVRHCYRPLHYADELRNRNHILTQAVSLTREANLEPVARRGAGLSNRGKKPRKRDVVKQ